jgi:hypothetical protein
MALRTSLVAAVILVSAATFVVDRPGGSAVGEIGTAVQQLRQGAGDAARTTEHVRYDDFDVEVIASYAIVGGTPQSRDAATAEHLALWASATRLLPPGQIALVRQLNIVTDGVAGMLAMVHRSRLDADGWVLTIDPTEPARVLEETLVHELAHLLTLGPRDVSLTEQPCREVALAIGCTRRGSALAAWTESFWPEASASFDPHRFVNEYATTGPHEDLAETFVVFVYGGGQADAPVVREKLAFLASWPELVEARTHVRTALGLA